jgi:hypothetical protein
MPYWPSSGTGPGWPPIREGGTPMMSVAGFPVGVAVQDPLAD